MKPSPGLLLVALVGCGSPPSRTETVTLPGTGISIDLVHVSTRRTVRPFWIAKHEVTWRDFNRFYEFPEEQRADGITRPSAGKNYLGLSGLPPEFLEPDRPVTGVRYHSAMAYCEWLSKRTGEIFRLPTETEWESACLPGSVADEAWSGEGTHAAGGKKPNGLGLHDMLGNAWEYCLESRSPPEFEPVLRGGAWTTPAADLSPTLRTAAPADWSLADPNRPFSLWWFRSDFSQGFRVVRVVRSPGPAADPATVEITGLTGREHAVRVGGSSSLYSRVTGTVRNRGDRALDELLLKVFYLDPAGRPHLEDVAGGQNRRATYNYCTPVLVNSAHEGEHARPLKPGESRAFTVDVPASFDGPDEVRPDAFGVRVLHLVTGD